MIADTSPIDVPVDAGVYIDGNYVGQTGQTGNTFDVVGNVIHTIGVEDWVPTLYYGYYEVFSYFDGLSGGNPATVVVTSSIAVTAHYYIQSG